MTKDFLRDIIYIKEGMMFAEPKKAKIAFFSVLALLILTLIGSGVLGYFYYRKYKDYKNLNSKYEELNNTGASTKADLEKQLADSKKEAETLKSEKETREKQITDKDAGAKVVRAYTDFLKYMTSVIETHGGFTGWTEAEHQIGVQKAQATGSSSFVEKIEWAWHNTNINPATRVVAVWYAIVDGINGALK